MFLCKSTSYSYFYPTTYFCSCKLIPWQGDPYINLQDDSAKAKPYQVRQILAALDKLKTL